jgi:hypothetical protein
MYTNTTLVTRPTMPAKKNQTHAGRPFEIVPAVSIITYVTNPRPTTDRIVVTQ